MKILTRYILLELVKWFVVALSALTLIIAVFVGVREALQFWSCRRRRCSG